MKYFGKFIFGIVEKTENLASLYPSFRDMVLADIRQSIQKENEVNDIMFCFLINAGETFIQNKRRRYGNSRTKTFALLTAYNNLINSYFSLPVKTQLSAEADTYLKEFQKCYRETLFADKGPFPGCNEFCKNKCLFRYDVEPSVNDKSIDDKMIKAIKNGNENEAKFEVRKLCLKIAQNLTIANSDEFVKNIALCFFIQKSVQWSAKEVLQNISKWFFNLGDKQNAHN